MLDLKLLRAEPETVRAALARRGDADGLDEVLALDAKRRELLPQVEALRASQNEANAQIAAAKKAGAGFEEAVAAMKAVSAQAKELGEQVAATEAELDAKLAQLPNLPDPTAAPEDTVVSEWGEAGKTGKDHLELMGERVDMERGARLSGSRFAYLRGDMVRLELALVQWAIDKLVGHGFEPVVPPVLVREKALFGTGFLPDTEQQIYTLPDDDLYLVGTSEVALASMHAEEILDEDTLPRLYAGFSPCFRREAGAAGKDTRGIFRVHQFDKVEMFCFVRPEESVQWHDKLLAIEEEILQELEIPYRVVNIAVDDLGSSAAKKYDCEAWMPGQGAYREVTSTSNTTDYQARRLEVRMRPADGGKPVTLHTLNGTAATWRHLIAVIENGQQDDGTIAVPAALQAFGAPATLAAAS